MGDNYNIFAPPAKKAVPSTTTLVRKITMAGIIVIILGTVIGTIVYSIVSANKKKHTPDPVYTAMLSRTNDDDDDVNHAKDADAKIVHRLENQEATLSSMFEKTIGQMPPGSVAAEAYQKFEQDLSDASKQAQRVHRVLPNADTQQAELAEGFQIITEDERNKDEIKQLTKWQDHCKKSKSTNPLSDMDRQPLVESQGHGSLGCDINRHILKSFRGENVTKPVSSGRFTCFQDSSHRHHEEQVCQDAEMATFPIMCSATDGTPTGCIGQAEGFFNE